MTPLPQNPEVVILLGPDRGVLAIASNIDPNMTVTVTSDVSTYKNAALGKPFCSDEKVILN